MPLLICGTETNLLKISIFLICSDYKIKPEKSFLLYPLILETFMPEFSGHNEESRSGNDQPQFKKTIIRPNKFYKG